MFTHDHRRCTSPANDTAGQTDTGAYETITGAIPPVAINSTFMDRFPIDNSTLPDFKMLDLRTQVPRFNVSGNYATFTGFNAPDDASEYSHIDFIFGGSNGGW